MMSAKYFLLFLVLYCSAAAQRLDHSLMASREDIPLRKHDFRAAADTVNILVVMVQFQQDNTPLTTGDGRFDLSTTTNPVIDAPPHDRQYVMDHFQFAANYFRKASKGKTILQTTVLNPVITLPGLMQEYSPPRSGSTIAVGNLARDTWLKVDSAGLVQDFSLFNCFAIVHAGVGRDIDMVSLLGYDPTPYDIPSLYIGLNGFKQYYGNGYEGIPVSGGTFHITNTMVLPESESRTIPTATGTALLELSTNGLICASIGNYLGLPDLFNTNTGDSGIGRFGLMDGQAIFSFAGTFPPEPSAWEKYWLGWVEPIRLRPDSTTISLPAVAIADSIYRVPISAQEYFLVENRNRDPQRNGQTVTYRFNGQTTTVTFLKDTIGFYAADISALAGVVLDVEDLDWSLPGGTDNNGTFYDGGVLIWHIDEGVIARGLATNTVNGDPNWRGVDLEEADGSQDIGRHYELFSAGSGSEEGTALDYWYLGNASPVNRNIFSRTSYPDSRSNTGANSHITIKDFSARGPHMTAKVVIGDNVVKPIAGFPKALPNKLSTNSLTAASTVGSIGDAVFVTMTNEISARPYREPLPPASPSAVYAWKLEDGSPALRSDGVFLSVDDNARSFVQPVSIDSVGRVVLSERSRITLALPQPNLVDSQAVVQWSTPLSQLISTVTVIGDSTISVGEAKGKTFRLRFDGAVEDSTQRFADSSSIAGMSRENIARALVVAARSGAIDRSDRNLGMKNFGMQIAVPPVVGLFGNELRVVFATTDGELYAIDQSLNPVPGFPVRLPSAVTQPLALADIDGDGNRDIIVFAGTTINVYNMAGASLDNFPKTLVSTSPIASNPVVADIDGDGDVDIIAVTRDGLVVAYDKNATMADGFPLQAGRGDQSVAAMPIATPELSRVDVGLVVASSDDGSVNAWKTASTSSIVAPLLPWPQYQRDAQHSGRAIEPLTGSPLSSDFFPKSRAYNWPNPVYDGKTLIRYYLKDNATVNIKIMDLAGDLVTTIPNAPGIGGVDNEVEWNVGGIQSGIYFARIEANGAGGNGVAIIKIAVVK